jgi:hypothetical protein
MGHLFPSWEFAANLFSRINIVNPACHSHWASQAHTGYRVGEEVAQLYLIFFVGLNARIRSHIQRAVRSHPSNPENGRILPEINLK